MGRRAPLSQVWSLLAGGWAGALHRVLGAVWASLVAVEGYEEDSLFWCDLSSPVW